MHIVTLAQGASRVSIVGEREGKRGLIYVTFLLSSLYVTIDPDPLDTGPEPGVHWLVWIVEPAGERLLAPHRWTD